MSVSDLWIRDLFTNYGLLALLFSCAAIVMSQQWSNLQKYVYKAYLTGFEVEWAEIALPHRKRLFKLLHNAVSSDERLRSMGCIRVLEIGVKTGENIPFYPDNTHLISVDRNLKLAEYLIKGKQFSHVSIERVIVGDGSSLKNVPTGYVDVVVTTRSLCSAKSIPSTLREIHRVLAPGGQYLFIEHVPETEGTFVYWLQKVLSQMKIWPSLFGGCRLTADPIKHIRNIGFASITCDTFILEGCVTQNFHLVLSRKHILGIAIR
ncbi:thiol S-methyltransferase TMT1A-like [Halictus rubicundus]|uniref:thiol S-methyltransferase TMT1A-like n=1 Tax=Halictus rubicundus TaxID=77578 RepID=UPI004035ADBA